MRLISHTIMLCLTSLILSACTKAGLFLANAPSSFSDAKSYTDISYGKEDVQNLDLYVPPNAQNAPVLIFLYGGRWTDGYKEQYRFVADVFTKQGYIVVIPDYRKYPNVKFPAFVEDGASATKWVHKHIADYKGDPDHIFLAGHSSGAHIGALLVTDAQYLKKYDLNRDVVKGFAGLSGPYAFIPEAEDLKDMFGPPERYPQMRAPNFVDGNQPPMLLIHGLKDTTVVLENAKKLKEAVDQKGGQAEIITYKDINHVETVGSLMWFWRYKADIQEKMLAFFEAQKE